MTTTTETLPKAERVLLVGIQSEKAEGPESESLLRELRGLAKTLGLEVVDQIMVKLREKTANLLVGKGKADEITTIAKSEDVDSIIFDYPLSPVQQRNWETLSGKKAYDRAELILKIFSARAMTKEASLQVELARLQYALPRLAHSYEDLSRQRGGRYGTKGSGEQKIELDRRSIEKRIHEIEDELENVKKSRSVQRKKRERIEVPRAALVGYTNVGKSSLLNAISRADALAEDKLFATLDPMTRRLSLSSGATLLVTDTVGFVRNLPHGLIEAFNATLEEAANADILIHVADASDPETAIHMATTDKVLSEIGAALVPRIHVLNKIDIADSGVVEAWQRAYPDGALVSAATGEGIQELVGKIEASLTAGMEDIVLEIPHADYAVVSLLHREGSIISEESGDESTRVHCRIPQRTLGKVAKYRLSGPEKPAPPPLMGD